MNIELTNTQWAELIAAVLYALRGISSTRAAHAEAPMDAGQAVGHALIEPLVALINFFWVPKK